MTILGLDPGLARLGWGVIQLEGNHAKPVAFDVVETSPSSPTPIRLRTLYDGVKAMIAQFKPDEIAIEELFFSKNVTTGIAVGQARGVILLACTQHTDALFEYTPMQVKQAVVGYGKAEKAQVGEMVRILLKLEKKPSPDDVADALAVALCHAHSRAMRAQFKLK